MGEGRMGEGEDGRGGGKARERMGEGGELITLTFSISLYLTEYQLETSNGSKPIAAARSSKNFLRFCSFAQ